MDGQQEISISTIEQSSDKLKDYGKDHLVDIFINFPVAVIEIDYDGTLRTANKKAYQLLKCHGKDLLFQDFKNFIFQQDIELFEELIRELQSSASEEAESFEIKLTPKEDEIITVRMTPAISTIKEHEDKRILIVIEDITRQKEEQAEFERYFEELQITRDDLEERSHDFALLNEKLRQSEMQLEEMNKNKDRFFSLISHDLRSPFNSLLGLTRLIYEDYDSFSPQEIKDSVYNLQQVAEGMYNLIEDLLDWSRIQFNNVQFEVEDFNLFEKTSTLIASLKSFANDKNITIVNVIPKDLELTADLHMITTILRNLINNSIKFTPKYGLIKVSAKRELDLILISVEDNGIGMKYDKVKNLFKVGSKVSSPGTEGETGTGLGLLLCKEFIEQHGGEIWVESEKDKGTKFTFTIPYNHKSFPS